MVATDPRIATEAHALLHLSAAPAIHRPAPHPAGPPGPVRVPPRPHDHPSVLSHHHDHPRSRAPHRDRPRSCTHHHHSPSSNCHHQALHGGATTKMKSTTSTTTMPPIPTGYLPTSLTVVAPPNRSYLLAPTGQRTSRTLSNHSLPSRSQRQNMPPGKTATSSRRNTSNTSRRPSA